ncbi:hypothetical protein H0W80_01360 [Candidatus Saccharibacteria bacterium]|nr:hypothetical protein [Candidatus Saccharibacteria bacterium]
MSILTDKTRARRSKAKTGAPTSVAEAAPEELKPAPKPAQADPVGDTMRALHELDSEKRAEKREGFARFVDGFDTDTAMKYLAVVIERQKEFDSADSIFVVRQLLLHHTGYVAAKAVTVTPKEKGELNERLKKAVHDALSGTTLENLSFEVPLVVSVEPTVTEPKAPPVAKPKLYDHEAEDDDLFRQFFPVPVKPSVVISTTPAVPARSKPPVVAPKPIAVVKPAPSGPLVPVDPPSSGGPPKKPSEPDYKPTEVELAAESVLISLIEKGVREYDDLFRQFFVLTKRAAWPDVFLDYLEAKYAANIK